MRNVLGAIVLLLFPAVAMAQGVTQSADQGIEYRPLTKEALLESDPSAALSWKILVDAANLGSSGGSVLQGRGEARGLLARAG